MTVFLVELVVGLYADPSERKRERGGTTKTMAKWLGSSCGGKAHPDEFQRKPGRLSATRDSEEGRGTGGTIALGRGEDSAAAWGQSILDPGLGFRRGNLREEKRKRGRGPRRGVRREAENAGTL